MISIPVTMEDPAPTGRNREMATFVNAGLGSRDMTANSDLTVSLRTVINHAQRNPTQPQNLQSIPSCDTFTEIVLVH